MSGEVKLTKAIRRDLEWFAGREGAHLFGPDEPSLTMVRKLHKRGWLETYDRGRMQFVGYRISSSGLAVLQGGGK